MKGRIAFFIICVIVIADQALKIYVKTHYHTGESHNVIGNWFRLYFIENEGMAYGWKFGGNWGKLVLTLFRLTAVIFGIFYIKKIIEKKYHPGFIVCVALIFAGALGNLVDSMFYGIIFEDSSLYTYNVAKIFPRQGYAGFLHGKVVDMLYFPVIRNAHFPSWFPVWGGEDFEFFRPIFNLSDAAISVGIITILVFQKRFFKNNIPHIDSKKYEAQEIMNDNVQVS